MASKSITRREFLAGAAAAGCVLQTPCRAHEQASAKRPNFVVILTDDHMYRAIGYNNPAVRTPHLDALAHEGMVLDRAYIATPICASSRASLLTGLFPQQHGSVGLDAGGFRKNVVDERRYPSLAHTLAAAGYDTAFCGKSHLGPPAAYGFGAGKAHHDLTDAETFSFAREFLESRAGDASPFLLWVATHQPHIPLQPGGRWQALYADANIPLAPNFRVSPPPGSLYNQGLPGESYYRDSNATKNPENVPAGPPRTREQIAAFTRAYYAVMSQLDHQVGQLVETLRATGLYGNTVIVYLSDNGYFLGNHGLGNKITMLEESVRVPMFIRGPGVPPGARTESLVSSLDLYPTLAELAGAAAPAHLAGKSLAPLFKEPGRALREYVASECVGVGGKPGTGHRMVCNGRWKYILTGVNEEALFDLEKDPYEMENVVADAANRQVLEELRGCLRDWMDRTGDTHPPPPDNGT